MLMHDVVAVSFRLLNFAVIIALAIYGFKKYVVALVQAQIAARQHYLEDLRQQAQQLQQQSYAVERATQAQENLCKNLDVKVLLWRSAFNKNMQEREGTQELRKLALHEKSVIQGRYLVSKQMEQQVVPQAIADAKNVLLQQYHAPDQGRHYIANIINYMKKS